MSSESRDLTLPIPNGWFAVAFSKDLVDGEVKRVRAFGEVRGGLFGFELVHPRWRLVGDDEPVPDRLTPIYSTAAGIGQAKIRAAVE